jgi:ribokinase
MSKIGISSHSFASLEAPVPERVPSICVVGSSNVDLTFRVPRVPRLGETLAGHGYRLGFGGKGANQAVAAARLGAQVALVTKVGKDAFGEAMLRNYQAQGLDTAHVLVDERLPTGVAAIVVDDSAQNAIIGAPGANLGLTPEDVRAATGAIQRADALVAPLEVPVVTVLEAFRIAKSAGIQTILNPSPALALPQELWLLVDFCVPNEVELEVLTSHQVSTLAEAERAGRLLQSMGPQTVICTLGDKGALILAEGAREHVPAFPVKAVDPTAAGDAFAGGLAVFLAEGLPLAEAVLKANAVAGLSVTRMGAQDSLPTRKDVDRFLAAR